MPDRGSYLVARFCRCTVLPVASRPPPVALPIFVAVGISDRPPIELWSEAAAAARMLDEFDDGRGWDEADPVARPEPTRWLEPGEEAGDAEEEMDSSVRGRAAAVALAARRCCCCERR